MRKTCLYLAILLITLGTTANSFGDEVVVGNFEDAGLDGAWAGDGMTLSQSTTGATLGSQAVQVDGGGGWKTGIWLELSATNRDKLASEGAQISLDVTVFDADLTTGWMAIFAILNGQHVGWSQLADQYPARDGQPQTLTWDIPADKASTIASNPSASYFQLVIGSNLDGASITKYYVDNIKIIYPAAEEEAPKSTDLVIASWENDPNYDGWVISETADPLFNDHNGVTLGDYSLDLYIEDNAGWNGSIMTLDVVEANLVEAVQLNTKLSVDVTRLVDDWASDPVPGWNEIVFGINAGGPDWSIWNNTMAFTVSWRQTDGDQTATAVFDYSSYLAEMGYLEQIDWFEFMITSNVDSSYPGPILFYMDNMKLTGAGIAVGPNPADDANSIGINSELTWREGPFAASHVLYIGTDAVKVANATMDDHAEDVNVYELSDASFDPNGLLQFKTQYFWRVDEVNDANPDSPWKGNLWDFTTGDFIVIEDFEDYNNYDTESEDAIFYTWVDGYGIDENGSYVGHDLKENQPICEEEIVFAGNWSMPFYFNNEEPALASEAQRTWDEPQVWKDNEGTNTLKLYIYGDSSNNAGQLYIDLEDAQEVSTRIYHPNSVPVFTTEEWQEWEIVLNEVADVNLVAIKKMTIGVENIPGEDDAEGLIFIDSIRRYPTVPVILDPNHIEIRKTTTAPAIDGVGDGIWAQIDAEPLAIWDLSNADSIEPESAADLSASFKACFDDTNFYLFLEVTDSVIEASTSDYLADGLEVYFDGDYSHTSEYDGVNDNQIRITADDEDLADTDASLEVPGMVFKVLLTAGGYNIEAAFPLAELQIAPSEDPEPLYDSEGQVIAGSDIAANNVIGFEVQINDNDTSTRETVLRWFSDDNNSYQDPSLFGQARLLQELVGE